MPKPLKVRRVNEIVGMFVLLALAIAVAAALFGPHTQRWFTPAHAFDVHLPPEGSLGLRQGSDVQILGSVVGAVEDIVVTQAGEMIARVSVRGNFIRFVREDSQAVIRKPLGIGDATIEITRGHGRSITGRNVVLQSTADKAPSQLVDETLAAIRDEALPAIRELRGAIGEFALLATELRARQGDIKAALDHFNRVGAVLESGDGLASMLLSDPAPAAELRSALPKLSASLDGLQAILAATREATDRLPEMSDDMHAVLQDLRASARDTRRVAAALPALQDSVKQGVDMVPGLMLQGQETLWQVQRLTEGVQRSWWLGGGVEPPERTVRLSGDRVGTDR